MTRVEPTAPRPLDPLEHVSPYEREKHDRTLAACGPGPLGRVLVLGDPRGVLSARLAERCAALVTMDPAPGGMDLAAELLARYEHVEVRPGPIPDGLPHEGGFGLVVTSEILRSLSDDAFRRTIDRLPRLLRAGGRLVAVHWSGHAPDLLRGAADAHRAVRVGSGLRAVELPEPPGQRGYLLDAFEMR